MPEVRQPVADDSIKVRQLSHYQFSWIAGEPGTYTLQLVLDRGAWEEVLTIDAADADALHRTCWSTPRTCTTTSAAGAWCSASRAPAADLEGRRAGPPLPT